jgi:hypothetical protein
MFLRIVSSTNIAYSVNSDHIVSVAEEDPDDPFALVELSSGEAIKVPMDKMAEITDALSKLNSRTRCMQTNVPDLSRAGQDAGSHHPTPHGKDLLRLKLL